MPGSYCLLKLQFNSPQNAIHYKYDNWIKLQTRTIIQFRTVVTDPRATDFNVLLVSYVCFSVSVSVSVCVSVKLSVSVSVGVGVSAFGVRVVVV